MRMPLRLLLLTLYFLICIISLGWCKQEKMDFQLEAQNNVLVETENHTVNRKVRKTERKRKVKVRRNRKSRGKKKKRNKSTRKKKRNNKSGKNQFRKFKLKKKSSTKTKKKSGNNQRKKKKSRKNEIRKKKLNKNTRSCEKQDDPCLKNLVDSLSFERDQITNFLAQYKRIKNFAKLVSNKAAKKGDFSNSSSQLLEALGGNGSSPACGGQRMTRGSRNAAVLNYNQLAACSETIASSCQIPNATYSTTALDACTASYEAIQNKNKDCCAADETGACPCWAEAKALVDTAKSSSCDGLTPSNAVKKLKVSCISSFSGCKKAEDASIGYIVTCRTCNSSAGECDLTTPASTSVTTAAPEGTTGGVGGGGNYRCGVSPIGRTNAGNGKFPWIVSIADSFDAKKTPFCAGTLVSVKTVLTAASCSFSNTEQIAVDKVSVVLGEYDLESTSESSTYKVVGVSSILVHPSYSTSSVSDNMALWTLSSAVDTSVYTPVCLPTSGLQLTGSAVIVGWRISSSVGSLKSFLQEETVTLVDSQKCGAEKNMICASQEAACQGDSGGPLLQKNGETYSLVGSVTSLSQCTSQVSYGAYTNIPSYVDWIETQVLKSGVR